MKSVQRKHTRHEFISFSHRHSERIVQMQRGRSTQLWSYQPGGGTDDGSECPLQVVGGALKPTGAAVVVPRQNAGGGEHAAMWLLWNRTLWSCFATVLGYRWRNHVLNHERVTPWITVTAIKRCREVTSSESGPSWSGAVMCLCCVMPTPACVSVIFCPLRSSSGGHIEAVLCWMVLSLVCAASIILSARSQAALTSLPWQPDICIYISET